MEMQNNLQITLELNIHSYRKTDTFIDIKTNHNSSITVKRDISALTVPLMSRKANRFTLRILRMHWNFIEKKGNSLSSWTRMDGWIKPLNSWGLRETTKLDSFQTGTGTKRSSNWNPKSNTRAKPVQSLKLEENTLKIWVHSQARRCESEQEETQRHKNSVNQFVREKSIHPTN